MIMNKKKYVNPAMQVYKIEPTTLLAASDPDLRGPLYDGIGSSDEYCTTPA